MKKTLSLCLALALLLSAGLSAAAAEDTFKVAGIVFKDEFTMKMVQQGYQDAAKDLGVEILIGNSMGDIANEQQLINGYVDMGVKGIAITPYSEEASSPMLREAYDRGVQIAVANIKLKNADFICGGFTSQDRLNGQKLGEFMAPVLEERFGKENPLKIAIIDFDAAIPEQSKARYGGFLDALTAYGFTYDIVAQQSSTSKQDNVPIIEAMLTGAPDCNVFYNTSAAFTAIAVQVVKTMGLDKQICVVGYDMGEQVAGQLLEEGTPLYCTLEQDMYTMGYKAVEQLVKTIRGEETECKPGETVYLAGIIHSVQDLPEVQSWLDRFYALSSK
ncbi:MAG: sugar ABC transporter substrate-binding protein [Clostridiales bacterium]|nr:sugar ABC transporter substrate-binding protein [Clostridiales bacterium]